MSIDPEMAKALIYDHHDDKGAFEDVELQKMNGKKSPLEVITAIVTSSTTVSPNPKDRKGLSRGGYTRRKKGCPCWCKCIGWTVLVFLLLFIFVLGCAYAWLNGFLKEAVAEFTIETSTPKKFDIVEMSDLELKVVEERVMLFVDELAGGTNTDYSPLVLTQDEINGFIGHCDYLRGNMMVSFHDNLIEEEYSLPMDVLGYDDRYFVAKDYLKLVNSNSNNIDSEQGQDRIVSTNKSNKHTIEMKLTTAATHEDWFHGPLLFAKLQYLMNKNKDDRGENVLSLFLEKGSFFGENAPQEFIDQHYNLLESLYINSDDEDVEQIRNVISGIESVSIEEGRIIVNARHKGNK